MDGSDDFSRAPHRLSPAIAAQLRAEAARAHPHEACGLLLGGGDGDGDGDGDGIAAILPAPNVATDPARRFEIAPEVLIAAYRAARAGGAPVLGYYHSHPVGSAAPSAADRAEAHGDGALWAIIGGGDIRVWRDEPEGFALFSKATQG